MPRIVLNNSEGMFNLLFHFLCLSWDEHVYKKNQNFKGAGTTPTQIFTIIGFWLLGITNFFLGVCRAPTKGGS